MAFAKSQFAAGQHLPLSGVVFMSIRDRDKDACVEIAQSLKASGFDIIATRGTWEYLKQHGVENRRVFKVSQGRPNVVDLMKNGEIALVINTPSGKNTVSDSYQLRRTALEYEIPYFTTIAGARAAARAISALISRKLDVKPVQEYYSREQKG